MRIAVVEQIGQDFAVGGLQRVGVVGAGRKRLEAVAADVAVFGQHERFAVDDQGLRRQIQYVVHHLHTVQHQHVALEPLIQHIVRNGGYDEAVLGNPSVGLLPHGGAEVVQQHQQRRTAGDENDADE